MSENTPAPDDSNINTARNTDSPSGSRHVIAREKPIHKRLIGAQESGLVLVILIMAALLTFLGGDKDKRFALSLDADDTWTSERFTIDGTDSDGNAMQQTRYRVTVTINSDAGTTQRVYPNSSRPRERVNEDAGTRELFVTSRVNKFLDGENLVLVAKDASFIAIMAVGMTAIIILAGIDLSVGAIYGIAALIGAMALHALDRNASIWVSLPVGVGVTCLVGLICGIANGAMTVGFKVHPFVITLGTMAAFRGIIFVISGGQSVGEFPESFTSGFFKAEIAGTYPVPVIVMVVVALAGYFVLSKTVLGRQVYAIGGNETAAAYAGIPVGRVKIIVFAFAGLLAGLSAAVYLGYLGAAEPNAGMAYELQVIAATVIGGASLMGGRGTAIGAVLGAIIIQLISNGMIILGIDQSYNQIVMGTAIIVAVVIDQFKARFVPRG